MDWRSSTERWKVGLAAFVVVAGLLDLWALTRVSLVYDPDSRSSLAASIGQRVREWRKVETLEARSPLAVAGVQAGNQVRFDRVGDAFRFLERDEPIGLSVRDAAGNIRHVEVRPIAEPVKRHEVIEIAMMVSFYACFLLSYLLYRYRSPRFLYAALVFAALTFYSYANGQLVIGVTGILLAISDLRYHCRQWRTALPAGVVVALMAMPSVLFYQQHPAEAAYHLRMLDSYVVRDLTLSDKIGRFIDTYRYGVSPQYWFVPNDYELARQRMKDYGHIAIWMLPLFVIGVGLCLRHIASSAHRVVLIALLAAPVGGALTAIGITRVLAFVVPAAMAITLGLDWVLGHARNRRMQLIAPVLVFLILSAASLAMFRDALTNGPLWFRNYGLYGMQWGAQQIFAIIRQYLQQSPQTRVYLTPTWANGTDAFRDYFTPEDPRVQMETVDGLMDAKHALDDSMVFVVTADEYRRARASGKFKNLRMERTLKYPDGSDGFYFVRIQ